ncbi:dynein regulatory complex subunit 2-like [Morone saxatilis]|uniref:dynein regulatory complex subunit 2-like n=1 Tax=Morone saxatilis TaxID=34816 RepID=UPI0015E213C4|nr:dynein regulatory complex subunit 2-like [Morone saxatilis]
MPKKAKKGGGGKGVGKTEEERLLYLQQRAQAEEELAQKKEEILTLFLKDKLQKEEKNSAVNLLKLNEGWRSILRQTRAAELRKDIAVLGQTFERHLDGLDSVIKNLEHDLQEAELQSARVRRIHLQHLERLWAQQHKRLTFVQQQWEDSLQLLGSTFHSERKQMLSNSKQQRADLADGRFTVEQQHRTMMTELHRLYSESMASYASDHDNRTASLVLEDKEKLNVKALQNQEAAHVSSKETKKLNELLFRNQNFTERADADVKKVQSLQGLVLLLRVRLNSCKTEKQSVEDDLIATKKQVNLKTHKLRDQLTQAQTVARKQLTDLTVQSDNAVKKLQAVIAKGERVLRAAEMCRKLESEQMNVLSGFIPTEDCRQDAAETEEALAFSELRRVTLNMNRALLQREALRRQRDDLSRENRQLKLLLRQHLDAMTVSEHAFDGHHALLAVHQAPTTAVLPGADRRHTVIEAVHVLKHSL